MFEPTLTCTEKIFEETDRLNYLMKRNWGFEVGHFGSFWNFTVHAKTC